MEPTLLLARGYYPQMGSVLRGVTLWVCLSVCGFVCPEQIVSPHSESIRINPYMTVYI